MRVVDGESDVKSIAEKFASIFKSVCVPYSVAQHNVFRNAFEEDFKQYKADVRPDFICNSVLVDTCIRKLKCGKAAGCDGLTAEHLLYAHPILSMLLSHLFDMMLKCNVVPTDFGKGIIIPLVINLDGDKTSSDNYRGITLSPVISKVFELLIMNMVEGKLHSSELQFGFKARSS